MGILTEANVYASLGIARPKTQPSKNVPTYKGAWTWVDAAAARDMLTKVHPRNRRPSKDRVNALMYDAANNLWVDAPNPVSFDAAGFLIDGAHRLTAIAKSGIGQYLFVMLNVPNGVVPGIDMGRVRSAKNMVDMQELEVSDSDLKLISTLVRRDQLPKLSKSGIAQYALQNLNLVRAVNDPFAAHKKTTPAGVGTFAVRSVVFCAIQNPTVAPVIDQFLSIYLGAELPNDLKHPAYVLREKMRASVGQQYAESGMTKQICTVERYIYNMAFGRFPNPKNRTNPIVFPNTIQP